MSEDANGDRWAIEIRTTSDSPKRGVISAAVQTARPTGTRVRIRGFSGSHAGLDSPSVPDALLGRFAREIRVHPLDVSYDGAPLDPSVLIADEWSMDLGEYGGRPASLEVLEWTRTSIKRALYLGTTDGALLRSEDPKIKSRGFVFTAYLKWDGFADAEADLALLHMTSGDAADVVDAARAELRKIVRQRATDRRTQLIASWQQQGIYPYEGEAESAPELATRETFDLIAYQAADIIEAGKTPQNKQLSLSLIKQALEQDPPALRRVLTDVLNLPKAQVAELAELLDKTELTNVIKVTKAVADRLNFLSSLGTITHERDWRKHVKERSQLHKILEQEVWVFGEQYVLSRTDKSLHNVLLAHIEELDRAGLAGVEDEDLADFLERIDESRVRARIAEGAQPEYGSALDRGAPST